MHLLFTHGLHICGLLSHWIHSDAILLPVLDPRISYKGMKADYADDSILSNHLEQSRSDLVDYFNANYSNTIPVPSSSPSAPPVYVQSADSAPMTHGSPQKSFTARYCRKEKASINELEEYFKLPAEDFDTCNLIHWWVGRRAQFPNLFCMACDILCIPGEFSVLYRSHFQHISRLRCHRQENFLRWSWHHFSPMC